MGAKSIEYAVVESHEQRIALEMVLSDLPPGARGKVLESAAKASSGGLGPMDALIVARRSGLIVGASWAQPFPGKSASIWPPVLQGAGQSDKVREGLVRLLCERADAAGVLISQALFEDEHDPCAGALLACGFLKLATLDYLTRELSLADASLGEGDSADELAFETYADTTHERFKRVIQRTYQESLDCPGLEGRRSQEEVLLGYKATGRFDPLSWFLATSEGQDVGVLLTAEHDGLQGELIYMGLDPTARGRRWGDRLVEKAIRSAAEKGLQNLMVAVDCANEPAKGCYERFNFRAWAKRYVYVRWPGGEN